MNSSIRETVISIVNKIYDQLGLNNVNIIVTPKQDIDNPSLYHLNMSIAQRASLRDLEPYRKVSASDVGEQCIMCMELYEASEFKRTLPCNHFFHKKCVDKWILEHNSCPVCRETIL